jgi:hypothetical protein
MARAEQVAKSNLLYGEIKYVVQKAVPPGRFLFRVLLPVFTPEDEANGFRDLSPEERVVMVVTVTADQLLDRLLFQKAALSQLGMWIDYGDPLDDPPRQRDEGWRRMVANALDGLAPSPGVQKEEQWRAAGLEFLEPPVEAAQAKARSRRGRPPKNGPPR